MSANGAECLRTVLSCARCRRRKIKCDRLAPACGRCTEAGVDCTGFNPKGDTEIPRSVVYFLEHEIANLEKDIGQNDLNATDSEDIAKQHLGGSRNNVSDIPIGHSPTQGEVMKEVVMASNELQSMIGATMPSGSCLTDMLSSVRMGLTPSYTPSSPPTLDVTPVQSSVSMRQHEEEVDIPILISLPTHVIYSLVKKFVQRVLPLYPFLHEPAIYKHVSRAIGKIPKQHSGMTKSSVRPDYDFLVLYLILAISSTLGSANSGHEARCLAFSGSLFSEGIHHLSSRAPFPNFLAEIQSNLLILQYALINPKYANVWILSGVVMRSCLELGLHREVSPSVGLDSLTIDLRRQVFWVAYCMDRSICSALQRPLSIPDPTINTLFPALSLSEAGVTAPRPHPTKLLALRQIQFAKLQSTIIEVHFQGKPLEDGQTWDEWLAATEQGLRNWYDVLPPEEDQTWAEVDFSQCLTNLYRPSPRVPFPSQRSLVVAFEAACGSAQIYQKHITTGFFRRPWLAAHNTFSSAMVALFCLRYGYEGICNRWNAGEIFQMTKLFTMNLLTLSAQGWSEISKYAGTYERLLGPLLDSVFTQSTSPSKSFGAEQDAELARLIYPGPAHLEKLRFGSAKASLGDDYQGFDAALFNWEDDFHGNFLNWGEEQGFANSCSVSISRQAQTGSISPSVSPISYRQNWLQY